MHNTTITINTSDNPHLHLRTQAREYKHAHQATQISIFTDCKTLGTTFGVGIGLYFQIIGW
jgi:hypothetical protein